MVKSKLTNQKQQQKSTLSTTFLHRFGFEYVFIFIDRKKQQNKNQVWENTIRTEPKQIRVKFYSILRVSI